jgi:DNA-binding winged helix-turn-helix (wHTH) protein/tetratricopeptide (TPR) repeat protein
LSEPLRYYEFGTVQADVREHRILAGGHSITATPKVFDTLLVFLKSGGRLLTKDELMREVWPDTAVEESNLTVTVSALRRLLAQVGVPNAIETLPRRGYRFLVPVRAVAEGHAAAEGPRSLLVVPFATPDAHEEIRFLGFGLADAIAGSIAAARRILVRPPAVAGAYCGRTLDLARIRADAAGDLVLTGSVLHQDHRLRLTVQLIGAAAGTVLWSRAIDAAVEGLFAAHDQIAQELLAFLGGEPQRRQHDLAAAPTSARAFEFYLRANQAAYETDHWETARDLYLACLREAPDFAPAWARLGRAYRLIAKFAGSESVAREAQTAAQAAFARALALGPDLSLTHNLYAQLEVDTGRAADAMQRLMKLLARADGKDPEACAGLVHALRFCGLLAESLAAHECARALDAAILTSVAHTRWLLGDFEGALQETAGDIGYMPGLALASLGRDADAIAALRWREQGMRDNRARAFLVSLRAMLEGKFEESRAALERAAARLNDPEALYYVMRTYARIGDQRQALDALEQVVGGGFCCYPALLNDKWLDSLRGDPRFAAILALARERHSSASRAFTAAGGPAILRVTRLES